MAKAFQKIYTKVSQITKATCSLKATGVGYDELATIDGKTTSHCRYLKVLVAFQLTQKSFFLERRLHSKSVTSWQDDFSTHTENLSMEDRKLKERKSKLVDLQSTL